ncbi:MAG: LPS biosynthesis protein WbpP, partial [Acidobacteria bacterium]|nr:LPS biosynthesis protein WbpP [Acidobacteriota bacterium]
LTGRSEALADYKEPRAGDVRDSQADNTRARECLNYQTLVGLEEGLQLTIDWWKQSRYAR